MVARIGISLTPSRGGLSAVGRKKGLLRWSRAIPTTVVPFSDDLL